MYTPKEVIEILDKLIKLPAETELVEFKKAEKSFSDTELGEYFSALANEANLKGAESAWLIFGVDNSTHKIIGTSYKQSRPSLDEIKKKIADQTTNRITFIEIYDIISDGKRVVMFQIPPAPAGMPIAYKGHYYGRESESLGPLNIQEIETIRKQVLDDWSAEIINDATIENLDAKAIRKAREEFVKRNPRKADEVTGWDDVTFLNKAKLTINGKITRTAMLLLGKDEDDYLLLPYVAKIRWSLKTLDNLNKDYEIFPIPFILAIDELYAKVRNIKCRFVRPNTLFPEEMLRYDEFSIREPLNNSIAHQDYSKCARIEVVEFEDDHLVFANHGSFIPGSVEEVVQKDSPESIYRNRFLVEAMRNLNMIETEGGGIKKMFLKQRDRFFPMPEYDLSNNQVKVSIAGNVLDERFAKLLSNNPDLSLREIMLLDKVQKRKPLTDDEIQLLRKRHFIEGRKPNFYLSDFIVDSVDDPMLKAQYIKNKNFDDSHYKDLIINYIKKYKRVQKSEIQKLIFDKLSPVLDDNQKKSKIQNILTSLRIAGKIEYLNGFWQISRKI